MEKIFWELYRCNTEHEVERVLLKHPSLFENDKNWKPYGGTTGNCATFENQQDEPIPALVEKITNSIDAILMKNCFDFGIDPKSKDAPQSMKEAVDKFYNVKNGEISELGSKDLHDLSNNLQIIASGDEDDVSILIYDNGIGQKHSDFEDTFLSLQKGNKVDIQFVQGKYNVGSTGSVVFCGKKKYQLIGSMSHDDSSKTFGFTLVRRHRLKETDMAKVTWYEYFCPDNQIPNFSLVGGDFGLYNNKEFVHGSLVKLYSYEMPKGSRGDVSTDLYRDLNQYLYDLPIPIRVMETRKKYKAQNVSKPIRGNRARIATDRNENVEFNTSLELSVSIDGVSFALPVTVVVFKSHVDHREFIKKKSLIFTVNGQIHYSESVSYISQELNFSLIKKDVLINVNCTHIPASVRQDFLMANRINVRKAEAYYKIKDALTASLKSNEKLKEINQSRKDELIRNSKNDKELLKTLMSSLPQDKELYRLLKKTGDFNFIKNFGSRFYGSKTENKQERPKLERFPSIFKISPSLKGKTYKTIPLNGKGYVEIETNVQNDYLFRPVEKGILRIEVLQKRPSSQVPIINPGGAPPRDVSDIVDIDRAGPEEGKIKLTIKPTEKARAGDEISIKASLSSFGNESLECFFDVKIDDKRKSSKKTEKTPPKHSGPNLPSLQKAYEKDHENGVAWAKLGWSGKDVVKIIKGDEDQENIVEAIVVNMDSNTFKNFIVKNKINNTKQLEIITKKYYTSIYFHSLFLYSIFFQMNKDKENDHIKGVDVEDFVASLIKPYSNFLLYESYHQINNITD